MGHHGTWGALRPNLWPQLFKFVVQKAAFSNLYRTILGQTRETLMQETMVCFFLFGVGGHPEVKKNSQTTKNSKSSEVTFLLGGYF